MPKQALDKRKQLVQTAMKLAYTQGFRKTTLADIAEESRIPLGNVYYYFKTKEEIGEAILEKRMADFELQREKWEAARSPQKRLEAFVQMTFDNREMLARGGCPTGTLCTELSKEGGQLAKQSGSLLNAPLTWIEMQFRELGKGKESFGLAVHLLSALQGVSLLAHSSGDPSVVALEANRLKNWITTLNPS